MQNKFGERLRKIRVEKGISVEELANASGIILSENITVLSKKCTSLSKMSRSLKRVKIGVCPPVFLVFLCPKAREKA